MYGRTVGQRDYEAEDAEERAILAKRNKALQLNPEWYEDSDQMQEDIQGRKDSTRKAIQERANQRGFSRQGGFATGNPMYNPMNVARVAGDMQAAQGNALQNMISQTTDAWRDEHDSRVSQNREMRRMQHEKEMEQMRIEAMLKRLEMERQQYRGYGGGQITNQGFSYIPGGGALRIFNPDTLSWDYTNEISSAR